MCHRWGGVYGQWLKQSLHCQQQVDDAPVVGRPELPDVALVRVHALEHEVEARA
jgi:hypothetical protein